MLRQTGVSSACFEPSPKVGAVILRVSAHVLLAQNALFRHVAARKAWGVTARQAAGHYEKWLNWANAFEQPPARLRGGCARARTFRFGVFERLPLPYAGVSQERRG